MNPYMQHIVNNKFSVPGILRGQEHNSHCVTLRALINPFYTTWPQTKFDVTTVVYMGN